MNIKTLEDALYKIMDTNKLEYAKEIAADALGIDLDEIDHEELDLNDLHFEQEENENPGFDIEEME